MPPKLQQIMQKQQQQQRPANVGKTTTRNIKRDKLGES